MKRKITKEAYQEEARRRWDCLNTDKLTGVIKRYDGLWVKEVERKYRYTEFDDKPVLKHYLIVPAGDYVESFVGFIADCGYEAFENIEKFLEELHPDNESIYFWKPVRNRSIRKFHIHYIVFKNATF